VSGLHLFKFFSQFDFVFQPSAVHPPSQLAESRKRRAGSEPPPRIAPSIRSGVFSGDGIVAAGRKEVFSRVAAARAAAAKAGRDRASRVRGTRASSPCDSTGSANSVVPQPASSTALVSVVVFY
jgi:hypothetical protein